ncbi:MAG: rhodanese-like domain-containing protein [Rubrivivax sp.]|nr:rhodanese-like domain-containing protein [Rubrivivax sp.]
MDFLRENWMLILLALSSGGMLLWPSLAGGNPAGKVGPAEAVRLMNREKAVLIDVSEPAEYAASHPAGARNVPMGALDGAKGLPSNKAVPIVVVCPSGARAGRAAALLRKQGYEKAVALAGGTRAWGDASLPLEKAA